MSLFTSLSSGGGGIDLFSPTCDFLPGLGITGAQILPVLCDKISPFECCYGTQIALYNQNQLNASAPSIFPACLLRYMSQKCPAVSAASVCGSGGRANISTITGVASIKTSAAYTTLPNMYDTLSVLTLQGVLTAALTTVLPSYNLPLYGLNYTRPLQVEIIDYTYSNATGQVSSTDGAPLVPADADFLAADRGVFTFLFVLENVDSATAVIIQHAINSLLFSAVVQKAGPYSSASVVSTAVPVSVLADPYPTYPSDDDGFDSSVDVGAWLVIAMCGVLLIILALLR